MELSNHIKGAIFEEIVLYLLSLVGYRIVKPSEEGTIGGYAGLEVQGRGEWHQIDALAAFDRTPAFMYPLRLMVEAKCYGYHRFVGIEVVRNSVGVQKDISENYFTFQTGTKKTAIQIQRYNYHSAIFSTSGYTKNAQRYAIAHQIFLIQYPQTGLLKPVIDGLLGLGKKHFASLKSSRKSMYALRVFLRKCFLARGDIIHDENDIFTEEGLEYLKNKIISPLFIIEGSYFGVLHGRWPLHLLSSKELPPATFRQTDEIPCKVYGYNSHSWSFEPVDKRQGQDGWFKLDLNP